MITMMFVVRYFHSLCIVIYAFCRTFGLIQAVFWVQIGAVAKEHNLVDLSELLPGCAEGHAGGKHANNLLLAIFTTT